MSHPHTEALIDNESAAGTIRRRLRTLYHSLVGIEVEHGDITGTLTLFASEVEDPATDSDDDWIELSSPTLTDPSGSASSFREEATDYTARWIMVKYVHSSGTGNITARMTLK